MTGQDLSPLNDRMNYAKALSVSDLLPKAYRNSPGNVLVAIEYGRALGLEPMAAIQGIHIVEGKPTASAQLIGALVRNAGHRLRVTGDDHQATATIVRSDDPDFEFTAVWTMERAAKAGLAGRGPWKTYPAAMLKARAVTEVSRDACPEVLSGVAYTEEELGHAKPATAPPPVPPVVTRQPAPAPEPVPVEEALIVDHDTGEIVDAQLVEEPEPDAATKAQLGKIGALCGDLGLDRDQRLAFATAVVGHTIASASELTKAQASAVIEELVAEVAKATPA